MDEIMNPLEIVGVIVVVAIVAAFTGGYYFSSTGAYTIDLGLKDNDEILDVSAGTVIIIKLPQNGTTGYTWQYTVNENLIKVVKDEFIPFEPPGSDWVGGGGTRILKLEVIGGGEGKVIMNYVCPWDNETAGYFSITLKSW